jgi:tRNA U34 5-carboxymethylaminomethyl modifying enzyme MnmG/GidA
LSVAGVVVVGAGAAGCELAWALAERRVDTTLLTTTLDTVYALPADRWLAEPAVDTLWARVDAEARLPSGERSAGALRRAVKRELERAPALRLVQSNVTQLVEGAGGRVEAVATWEGPQVPASLVVLAVGSFLGARLQMGEAVESAGRLSEMAYDDLHQDLSAAGVPFVQRELTLAGDSATPGYRVVFDAFAPDGLEVFEPGVARLRRWPNVYAVGLVAGANGLAAAAASGRTWVWLAARAGWLPQA